MAGRRVRRACGSLASDHALIRPTLCFVGAEWGWFARPFTVDGVRVIWPQELCAVMTGAGALGPARVDALARRLSDVLGPSRG
jgi:hypothetical protein